MAPKPKVLVFLGTSRQGAAVVDALLASDKFEVYATTRAELGFSTELCWYLDSTFCGWFHELKRAYGVEATALIGQARSAARCRLHSPIHSST